MRAAASDLGARAWVFAAESSGDRYIEFIEWQGSASLIEQPSLASPLDELNAVFIAEETAVWNEATM